MEPLQFILFREVPFTRILTVRRYPRTTSLEGRFVLDVAPHINRLSEVDDVEALGDVITRVTPTPVTSETSTRRDGLHTEEFVR